LIDTHSPDPVMAMSLRAYCDSLQQYASQGSFLERYRLVVNGEVQEYRLDHPTLLMPLESILTKIHQQATAKRALAVSLVMNLRLLQLDANNEHQVCDSIFVVTQTRHITIALIQPIQTHREGDVTLAGLVLAERNTVGFGGAKEILSQLRTAMAQTSSFTPAHIPSAMWH
jgi:hypothetical protein